LRFISLLSVKGNISGAIEGPLELGHEKAASVQQEQ
jgi:hypothetical protein